jgi:hypothetical protein
MGSTSSSTSSSGDTGSLPVKRRHETDRQLDKNKSPQKTSPHPPASSVTRLYLSLNRVALVKGRLRIGCEGPEVRRATAVRLGWTQSGDVRK